MTTPISARSSLPVSPDAVRELRDELTRFLTQLGGPRGAEAGPPQPPAPTLRQVLLAALHPEETRRIQKTYPQGYVAVLDGQPGFGDVEPLAGFGDLAIAALTLGAAREGMRHYHDLVRTRMHAPERPVMAGRGPLDGACAAEQYCRAACGLDKLLFEHELIPGRRLVGLKPPPRPEPPRDKALSSSERRDVARAVLGSSNDPALDVLLWMFLRTLGLRTAELCKLDFVAVNLSRGAVIVVGKTGVSQEMPVHRPMLEAAHHLMCERCPARTGPFFRLADGRTLTTGRHFDTWSRHIHADAPWTTGLRIGQRPLRHSVGQLIYKLTGDDAQVGLWLRHSRVGGTSGIYARDNRGVARWRDRRRLSERVWGPLDDWPLLPEWDQLLPCLALVTNERLPSAATMRTRRKQHLKQGRAGGKRKR